jgi:hypothetical protein
MTGNLTRFDRRLSPADQRTIVKATRTTSQGRAPEWCANRPPSTLQCHEFAAPKDYGEGPFHYLRHAPRLIMLGGTLYGRPNSRTEPFFRFRTPF